MATQSWLELALSVPIGLGAGRPFFTRGGQSVRNRSPNMWTLIGLGTARLSSTAWRRPSCPSASRSVPVDGACGGVLRSGGLIISLTLLGQILELKARSQTSAAIKSLLGLAPKTARRMRPDGTEEDVPLTHVHVDDVLRVRPGEKVPVDGVVTGGPRARR